MNVCGYVRVSSDGQTENYSIPQQKKAIKDYCRATRYRYFGGLNDLSVLSVWFKPCLHYAEKWYNRYRF